MYSLIKNRNEMLHDVYNKLFKETRFNIIDNIDVISFRHSKHMIINKIYDFINDNYYLNEKFKWRYSIDLFKYFIEDAIIIILYLPNKQNSEIAGVIIGKPINIMHNTNLDFPIITKTIDVNFLCVKREFRGVGVCKFVIDVLIKSVLEEDCGINSGLFTIGASKEYKMYSEKQYYFRIYNKKKVVDSCFTSDQIINYIDKQIDLIEIPGISIKAYNSINLDSNLLRQINDCLYDNNRYNFDIFPVLNLVELQKIMSCTSFLKIFILKDNKILGFVLLYKLDLLYNNVMLNNMFIYNYFILGIDEKYIWNCLDKMCIENNIDMMTSCFKHDDNFYESSLKLKYYGMNLGLDYINSERNGLVTI